MLLLLSLLGCGTPTYHADVRPILEGRCVGCHQAGAIGGFSLDSYDVAQPLSAAIAGSVEARTMPPWGAAAGHREYVDDPSLSDDQIALISEWAEGGAPEGDADDFPGPLEAVGAPLDHVDVTLTIPEAYSPLGAPDDYRCFVLEWPAAEAAYVTGFTVTPGNDEVVHHVAAYLFSPDNIMGDAVFEALDEWDAAEEGPGYTCFGGPSGENELQVPIQQLAQWVPGMESLTFPAGTGIEVLPGSEIVLQMHYYAPEDRGPDQTSIDFMLADSVERRGAFAPWLDATWPLGEMEIPAGDAEVTHDAQGDPRGLFNLVIGDQLDLDAGFDVHSVLMHMHTLGTHGEASVEKADGTSEVLVELPNYDFNWQFIYQLTEPVRFEDGDEMRVECNWDNSGARTDGDPIDVTWGEGTEDEMCVANLYITEL